MSSNSSAVILLSVSAIFLSTSTILSASGGGGAPFRQGELRERAWEASIAFRQAAGPNTTTVAQYYPSSRRGSDRVYTSVGEFTLKRAPLRFAFHPERVRNQLHGGCTYRFTHHGPRAEFSADPSLSSAEVVYPNIVAARHIPTATCPTNRGPTAEWQAREREHDRAVFCEMNRLSVSECARIIGRGP